MANIWKRKDRDTWVVDFREATGQRVCLTVRSREEAEEKLAEKIKESRKPLSLVEDRNITLATYAQRWLETAKLELALRTSRSYKQLLDVHVLPVLGHLRVVVDLPDDLYKQIRKLAGGSDNVSSFVYKEMRDNMRARVTESYQRKGKRPACPPGCRTVTHQVNHNFCRNCQNLFGP